MELLAGRTPKGEELYITTTALGFYQIERRGPGPRLELEDQLFTDLAKAKYAVKIYNIDNAKAFAKKANIDEIVEGLSPREHAKTLKNGALDGTVQGE